MFDQPQDFDRLSAFIYLLQRDIDAQRAVSPEALLAKAEVVNLHELRVEAAERDVPDELARFEIPNLAPDATVTHAQLANVRAYRLTGIGAPARVAVSSLSTYGPHGTNPDDDAPFGAKPVPPRVSEEVTRLVATVGDKLARQKAEAEAAS